MNFLKVNVTFYDTVKIIACDIIITSSPYSYRSTAKFLFVSVRINKDKHTGH